jgi:hypothetical protein
MPKSADSASITTVSVRLVDIDESDAADTALNLPIVEFTEDDLAWFRAAAEDDLAWFRAAVRS